MLTLNHIYPHECYLKNVFLICCSAALCWEFKKLIRASHSVFLNKIRKKYYLITIFFLNIFQNEKHEYFYLTIYQEPFRANTSLEMISKILHQLNLTSLASCALWVQELKYLHNAKSNSRYFRIPIKICHIDMLYFCRISSKRKLKFGTSIIIWLLISSNFVHSTRFFYY